MNIIGFDLGYVGCVSSGCLARDGHKVIGVGVNRQNVDQVTVGQGPVTEPGLCAEPALRARLDSQARAYDRRQV